MPFEQQEALNIDEIFDEWLELDPLLVEKNLQDELNNLEIESIQSFTGVIKRLPELKGSFSHFDSALLKVREWISNYHAQFKEFSIEINKTEAFNKELKLQTNNQIKLLSEIDIILSCIHVEPQLFNTLNESELSLVEDLQQVLTKIQNTILYKFEDPELSELLFVKECLDNYKKELRRFYEKLVHFITTKLVEKQSETYNASLNSRFKSQAPNLTLQPHQDLYEALKVYSPLVKKSQELFSDYVLRLEIEYKKHSDLLYTKETQLLLTHISNHLDLKRGSEEENIFYKLENYLSQPNSLSKINFLMKKYISLQNLGFFETLDALVLSLISRISDEKNFCESFFTQSYENSVINSDGNGDGLSKRVYEIIESAFQKSINMFNEFIESNLKFDIVATIKLLTFLEANLKNELEFILKLLSGTVCKLQSHLDSFFEHQYKLIRDNRLSLLQKRVGILPSVFFLVNLVKLIDLFKLNSEMGSRSQILVSKSIETFFKMVITQIDDSINTLPQSEANKKEPTSSFEREESEKRAINFFILNIENYHHLYYNMVSLGLSNLELYLEECYKKYHYYLGLYIETHLTRVFGKLLDFFKEIENLLKVSSPEEINFHSSYSKSNAKKLLAQYSAREIKKSLEALYKRLGKHFCTEENLKPELWAAFQERTLVKFQEFLAILQKCYPNSDVSFNFTKDEIILFFQSNK